jgi:hypothetical protein
MSSGKNVARPLLLALDPIYNQRTMPSQYLRLTVRIADETIVERAEVVDGQGSAVCERGVVVDLLKSSGLPAR